ncbi:MAG: hypothetical protein SGARI_001722 [Bacillariaceae sp.]
MVLYADAIALEYAINKALLDPRISAFDKCILNNVVVFKHSHSDFAGRHHTKKRLGCFDDSPTVLRGRATILHLANADCLNPDEWTSTIAISRDMPPAKMAACSLLSSKQNPRYQNYGQPSDTVLGSQILHDAYELNRKAHGSSKLESHEYNSFLHCFKADDWDWKLMEAKDYDGDSMEDEDINVDWEENQHTLKCTGILAPRAMVIFHHGRLTILPHVSRNFKLEDLPPHLRSYEEGQLQAMRSFQSWDRKFLPSYHGGDEITCLPGYDLAEATRVKVPDSWRHTIVKMPGAAQELSVGYVPQTKRDAAPIFPSPFEIYTDANMILADSEIDANHKRQRVS